MTRPLFLRASVLVSHLRAEASLRTPQAAPSGRPAPGAPFGRPAAAARRGRSASTGKASFFFGRSAVAHAAARMHPTANFALLPAEGCYITMTHHGAFLPAIMCRAYYDSGLQVRGGRRE